MSFLPSPLWIAPTVPIAGATVSLLPLTASLIDDLTLAGNDARIWSYYPLNLTNRQKHAHRLHQILEAMHQSKGIAFAVKTHSTGAIIGMTRLFNLCPANRQCEIGSWLHPDYWSTGINREVKMLLLQYCFETLKAIRVQFRTDARNIRSQMALEKLGAKYEGTLRAERILEDGFVRDAAVYGILEGEFKG